MNKYILTALCILFAGTAHAVENQLATVVMYDGDYIALDVDNDRIQGKRVLEAFAYCPNNAFRRGDRVAVATITKRHCGYRVSIANPRTGRSCEFRCPRDW